MGHFQNRSFKIAKLTDTQWMAALRRLTQDSQIPFQHADFTFILGSSMRATKESLADPSTLGEVLREESELIQQVNLNFHNHLVISISRRDDTTDNVSLNVESWSNTGDVNKDRPALSALYAALRRHFIAIDSAKGIATVLGPDTAKHYEVRANEIARLQSLIETQLREISIRRQELDQEYDVRRKTLEAELSERAKTLAAEIEAQRGKVKESEAALDERIRQVDNRESKFARRGIRKDLKDEIARRSKDFSLTKGTQTMRRPIAMFVLVLLCIFGVGLLAYSWLNFSMIRSGGEPAAMSILMLSIKQVAFAVAFCSTAIFYIRWQNRWFEQHAQEEFKLKRFDLDLDRASWIVEMALEWKQDKGEEIPASLLSGLSQNLFSQEAPKDEPLHPADQLASALLGAASKATIKLPGGSEISLDRKSLSTLQKIGDA